MMVPGCLQQARCHLFCNTIALFITKFLCCCGTVAVVVVIAAVAVAAEKPV